MIGEKIAKAHALPDKAAERFDRFHALLTEWNLRLDLTSAAALRDALHTHYLDSLAALPFLPEGAAVIDIGTGAGFPGVPLLLARPDIRMTLLDALSKRVAFLSRASNEVPFQADCVHARAEDFAKDNREVFDVAVSRAVATLPVLLEWALPLVRVGGRCVFWKGPTVTEEIGGAIKVAPLLGGGNIRVVNADVTACFPEDTLDCRETDSQTTNHMLVLVDKVEPTDARFPRKAGMAIKRPLA